MNEPTLAMKYHIEWIVPLEHMDLEEALEHLRGSGAAEVLDMTPVKVDGNLKVVKEATWTTPCDK